MNNSTDLVPVVQHTFDPKAYEGIDPATAKGLHDVFVHLWTRCDEASMRSAYFARQMGLPAEAKAEFEVISRMTDSGRIYGYMQHLLGDAAAELNAICDSLRKQLHNAYTENNRLKRELEKAAS